MYFSFFLNLILQKIVKSVQDEFLKKIRICVHKAQKNWIFQKNHNFCISVVISWTSKLWIFFLWKMWITLCHMCANTSKTCSELKISFIFVSIWQNLFAPNRHKKNQKIQKFWIFTIFCVPYVCWYYMWLKYFL